MCFERANYKELTGLMPVLTPAPLTKQGGVIPSYFKLHVRLATLNNPNHLLVLTLRNSMLIGINEAHPEAHPAGSINAVQICREPICISFAAFL
ncbi:Uncharacterised protein [Yersinia enterocolitica]|nr:Uncharacterised protein [Yersinia enterocolitica]